MSSRIFFWVLTPAPHLSSILSSQFRVQWGARLLLKNHVNSTSSNVTRLLVDVVNWGGSRLSRTLTLSLSFSFTRSLSLSLAYFLSRVRTLSLVVSRLTLLNIEQIRSIMSSQCQVQWVARLLLKTMSTQRRVMLLDFDMSLHVQIGNGADCEELFSSQKFSLELRVTLIESELT